MRHVLCGTCYRLGLTAAFGRHDGPLGLPLAPKRTRTMTHDYARHGTITLFVALVQLTGRQIAPTEAMPGCVPPRRLMEPTGGAASQACNANGRNHGGIYFGPGRLVASVSSAGN